MKEEEKKSQRKRENVRSCRKGGKRVREGRVICREENTTTERNVRKEEENRD